jgi:hypothetical protein
MTLLLNYRTRFDTAEFPDGKMVGECPSRHKDRRLLAQHFSAFFFKLLDIATEGIAVNFKRKFLVEFSKSL